ncbi:MAG: hypothetical protein ACN4E2_02310 [Nitrospinota bacterium]
MKDRYPAMDKLVALIDSRTHYLTTLIEKENIQEKAILDLFNFCDIRRSSNNIRLSSNQDVIF